MADPFAPSSTGPRQRGRRVAPPPSDVIDPDTVVDALPDEIRDALLDAGASPESLFVFAVVYAQADDEQRAGALAEMPDEDELAEQIDELEEILDQHPEDRQRIADRDPDVVARLVSDLFDDDEVEVPPDGTTGGTSGDGSGVAASPVADEVYDLGSVPATDGDEAGREEPQEAQDGQAGTSEPGAENAAGGEEEPAYTADDVPTDAKEVASWIAGAEDADDEADRARAAMAVEEARDGGVRKTVVDRAEKALAED